jgi:hypothetical protein
MVGGRAGLLGWEDGHLSWSPRTIPKPARMCEGLWIHPHNLGARLDDR